MLIALVCSLALATPDGVGVYHFNSTIFPDPTFIGGAPAALRVGIISNAWGDNGPLTPTARLHADLGAGLNGGFAWRTGLLLGPSLWVGDRIGLDLISGIEGGAITGGRVPAAARLPVEARLHLGPLSVYGRPAFVLGKNNPRQDGARLGDELDLGVGLGLGRLGLYGEYNELLGTRAYTVGLTWRGKDDDDEWELEEDWEMDTGLGEPQEGEGLNSAGTIEADGSLCSTVHLAIENAPTDFANVRGEPLSSDVIGGYETTLVLAGLQETWVSSTSLMQSWSWNTKLYEGPDAASADAAWQGAADSLMACPFPGGSWVYDDQDLDSVRYRTWLPFTAEAYTGVSVMVERLKYPDMVLTGDSVELRDGYMVFVRVLAPPRE